MAKIKMVRLAEAPYWSQQSEFFSQPGKVEISREGGDVHIRFLEGPLHQRIGHIAFNRWDYILYDDSDEKPAAKK